MTLEVFSPLGEFIPLDDDQHQICFRMVVDDGEAAPFPDGLGESSQS